MKEIILIAAFFILKVHCVDVKSWNERVSLADTESESEEQNYESCGPNRMCVPPHLCKNGKINTDGIGLIAPRSDVCPNILICCALDEVEKQAVYQIPPTQLKCGYRNPKGVMIKLENSLNESEFGEFPWMVALFVDENTFHCGGSLIHPKVVLTAAHRVVRWEPRKLKVRAGEWDRNSHNEPLPHEDRNVQKIIVHKDFNQRLFHNNVALLILASAFELSPHIATVCLPPAGIQLDYSNCVMAGWGKTAIDNKRYSDILKKINLNVVPKATCEANLQKTRLGPRFKLQPSHLCAGGPAGEDACTGDGGSALVCKMPDAPNRYYQVGIVSAGVGCGQKDVPGIYTDIAYVISWIEMEFRVKNLNMTFVP